MRTLSLLLSAAALFVAGCEKPATPVEKVPVHPVSGKVIYDGKPAAGVTVVLYPTNAPSVPKIPMNPQGVTGADGSFKVGTYGDGDGAAEGEYKVLLSWPAGQDGEENSSQDRLLGWYDVEHSTFTTKVKAGPNEIAAYELPVKTERAKSKKEERSEAKEKGKDKDKK